MAVEIGRLCMKLAGRDAGRECLIIEDLKDNFVMVDGNTRRKRCNLRHLEILPQKAKIKAKASHDEVLKALAELRIPVLEKGKATYKKKEKSAKTKAEKKTGLLEKIVGPKKEEKKVEKPKGATKKPAKKPATKKTPAKKPAAKKPATKKKTPAKKK